jgi:low temperature requirement protein LtrA
MHVRSVDGEERVTPLEQFFDLAFVFAITQVTGFLAASETGEGLLRGALLLAALWWAWGTYAWLTNTLDPEEGGIRLAVFAAAAAMLIVALATPAAFGPEAIVFGIAYFLVRALHLVLFVIAGRDDPELRSAVLRWAPGAGGLRAPIGIGPARRGCNGAPNRSQTCHTYQWSGLRGGHLIRS